MKSLLRMILILLPWMTRGESSADAVDYLKDVKPIFRDRCYACHGALKQKSDLRVDTGAALRRGGKDGPDIIASSPEKSPLWIRIASTNRDERMPPEGEALSQEQQARILRWIAQGAPSPADEKPEPDPREHWSFQPPRRPALPTVPRWTDRVANPIDNFIFSELNKRGLTPALPAKKEIQLRRVALDLTGLPPTREELRAYLADESPEAYERTVDRLLASPQYAQRWARHWMDIWRYADWYGRRHVPDVWNSAPQVWRWRDWIVSSLEADKGYDAMLTEMLAADETKPMDETARPATGYLVRNWYALNHNQWMRDIVEHTGKAFLGLTFNCAHCHDHKYDPISQRNYFEFRAFFEPLQVRQDWIEGQPDPGPFELYKYGVVRKIATNGIVSVFDERLDAKTYIYERGDERSFPPNKPVADPGVPAFLSAAKMRIERLDLPPTAYSPGLKDFIQRAISKQSEEATAAAERAWVSAEEKLKSARERMANIDVSTSTTNRFIALSDLISAEATSRQRSNQWRIAQASGEAVQARLAAERARRFSTNSETKELTALAANRAEKIVTLRKAEGSASDAEQTLALLLVEQSVASSRHAIEGSGTPKTDSEKMEAALKKAREQLAAAQLEVATNQLALESSGKEFSPPSPTFPEQSTGRRRALADWMTRHENPLTARVAVNHVWARHFHSPIVSTVFDFGRNGARPTHPELLDWLAVEFMEHNWSLKHLHRLIVTSSTYRQASAGNPANSSLDPENHYLWRMNPGQMEAELVRDSMLQVAGKLDPASPGQPIPNSEAEKSSRRSLYFECFPEPGGNSQMAELFDPPSSLECYRRTSTVVPQQALALSNSALSVECSRSVVKRLPGGVQESDFIIAAFEQVLSRAPTPQELATCREFLANHTQSEPSDDARASLVHVLFNHHDFVTIR